ACLFEFITTRKSLQLRTRQIDGSDFTAAEQQRRDVLKLFRRSQVLFRCPKLCVCERESVISFSDSLGQLASRDFSARMSSGEERTILRERRAQSSRDI